MLPLLIFSVLTGRIDSLPPDGPYLTYEDSVVVARWVDTEDRTEGSIVFRPENFDQLPDFASFRPEMVDPDRDFSRQTDIRFENVKRVAALSDIHGQFDTGIQLLAANGIIDAQQRWSFGDGHLVIVGDIFDRGDQVTELLWLIHNLEIEAEQVGGRVHFLLGNHETMTLEGDERYLNEKYRVTSGMTGKFYRELYGPNAYLGRWLRSLPLAVEINGTVYIHGGLSRAMVREVSSIDRLNELYHEYLIDSDDLRETIHNNSRLDLMYGRQGPLWYRGYFSRNSFGIKDLNYVLKKIGAQRIVVGHTSFTAVQGFYDNRVIAVDSSIKFGGVGEILIMENNDYFRGTISGEKIPLESSSTK
ncbi:metallophosphoesterase [Lewinella sp. JB7]|uniref:metallophosphoesterase n=1 Tax=Lewinella sp. JB7 TaxID=2962887 RepID=UPI0020CA1CA0|nr:metallophosphoesterase [Lewinella sp. JB7]MCP9235436.1 metallophosphoesterase [Lewinella sp. JB7]